MIAAMRMAMVDAPLAAPPPSLIERAWRDKRPFALDGEEASPPINGCHGAQRHSPPLRDANAPIRSSHHVRVARGGKPSRRGTGGGISVLVAPPHMSDARTGTLLPRAIRTAPKSCTAVLVNDTNPNAAPWVAAHWLEVDGWSGWAYVDELLRANWPRGPRPTHWLVALPAAPRPPAARAAAHRA